MQQPELTLGDVVSAAALLRGDPNFERFLYLIETLKGEMEADLESYDNIGNHAVMAFIAGKLSLCRDILNASSTN